MFQGLLLSNLKSPLRNKLSLYGQVMVSTASFGGVYSIKEQPPGRHLYGPFQAFQAKNISVSLLGILIDVYH